MAKNFPKVQRPKLPHWQIPSIQKVVGSILIEQSTKIKGLRKKQVFIYHSVLDSVFEGELMVNLEDVYAAIIAASLVILLTIFSTKPLQAARCVRWPMTTKPPSQWVSR